jgi:hypothetical protein
LCTTSEEVCIPKTLTIPIFEVHAQLHYINLTNVFYPAAVIMNVGSRQMYSHSLLVY